MPIYIHEATSERQQWRTRGVRTAVMPDVQCQHGSNAKLLNQTVRMAVMPDGSCSRQNGIDARRGANGWMVAMLLPDAGIERGYRWNGHQVFGTPREND